LVLEYIRYGIPPDQAEEFEAAYRTASECLDQSEHCLGYELARSVEAPENYVLRIEWDSLDGHEHGFRSSAEFRPFLAAVEPYLEQLAEMRHYEATTVQSQ
jgi:quinol monooxygenase YgiN